MQLKIKNIYLFSFLSLSLNCFAGDIWLQRSLDLGTITVKSGTQSGFLEIRANGGVVRGGNIYVVSPGQPAEITLEGFAAYQELTIVASVYQDAMVHRVSAQAQGLKLTQVLAPNSVTTDAVGEVTFTIGGRLEYSGDSAVVFDGELEATVDLLIQY